MKPFLPLIVFCIVGIVLCVGYVVFELVRALHRKKTEVIELPELDTVTVEFNPRSKR